MAKSGARTDLHHGHEDKVGNHFGQKERGSRGGRHALRIQHLVTQFARPGLIERGHGSEQGRDAKDAPGNLARDRSRGIEGQAEKHHHQQREEEHAVDGVFRSPLQAQVFGQMDEEIAHRRAWSLVRSATVALAARR